MGIEVTREMVLEALSKVQEPELHKDLVSLGMVKDIVIEGNRVTFTIELTTPACPLRDQIKNEASEVVLALPEVSEVEVNLEASVPVDSQAGAQGSIRNVVAIASGKGGVGKTTVAVNVAVALAQSGACVGLLDADIYGPNVPTMMGVHQIPPPNEKKIVPAEAHGVKVMSIGFLVPPDQPLIWRGPMLHSAIQQFINDVEWGELDYLIVDLPPGTGDAQLSLGQSVPLTGGIIVTLPQRVSLEDARRGLEMFRTMNVPIFGVVENMSYLELPDGSQVDVFGQGGGQSLAEETGVAFIGEVPMDPTLPHTGDDGVPIVISNPDLKSAKSLIAIAEALAAKISVKSIKGRDTIQVEMID
ncbi:MAG: P-loop NTPase [Anaerolineales bacterium]|nr:P-loop NTPase [Anaerolineales bacterium]